MGNQGKEMSLESQEKQKKRPLNRKFLLRGLVICVFLLLLPFAGILAYKQSLYYFYHGLWAQNYSGNYITYYHYGENRMEIQTARPISVDEVWQIAQECLRNFACEITYIENNYLPVVIRFNNASNYWLRTYNVFNCSAVPADDDLLQSNCRYLGFEPITNNE
jgi:hypothetical protein